jgi:tape measure domain-containing protein
MEGGDIGMSSIDSRVVEAKFDNKQFEQAVRTTLNSLGKLKDGLKLDGATKGLENVDSAAKRISLDRIANGVDKVAGKFNALTVIATGALARIGAQSVQVAERVVKAFTIDPIVAGFHNYETQINAVQTILANTGLKGAKGMKQVNSVLAELNTYANQTVYNFSEMAQNIGTFTAAGVKLKPAAESIKGIANLAAVSGSTSQQASTAMYQLSQAIAAGRVKLQDWNSVVNAGLGGKVFQKALFNTGQALHTIKNAKVGETFDQWTKAGNTFRGSLQDGWVTSKVLTNTLAGFTGDLTAAQLKSMGYSKAQIKEIQTMGKTAVDAATKIKTMTQLSQALKEEVATAYGAIFKTLFGDITQAQALFSPLHTIIENGLTNPIYALNKILQGWAKMGGRFALLDALKLAAQAIGDVWNTVKAGFREIFPPATAKTLYDLTVQFHVFAENLKPFPKTLDELKRTFAGVFAVFDIVRQVLGGLIGGLKSLFGAISSGGKSSGGFLNLTSNLGDFLVSLDKTLKRTGAIKTFFNVLASVLSVPLRLITALAGWIGKLFAGFDNHGANQMSDAFGRVGKTLSPLEAVGHRLLSFFSKIGTVFKGVGHAVAEALSHVGDAISKAITPQTFDHTLAVINTALIGAMALMVRNFFKKGSKGLTIDFGGGVLKEFKDTLGATTGMLKSMQQQIKAKAIMTIAIAMGILTASIVVLSTINGKKLAKAMAGVSVGIAGMSVSLAALSKWISSMGALKLPFIAAGLLGIATALLIYAGAMKLMSTIQPEKLGIALAGMASGLGIMAAAMKLMPKNPLVVAQGAGLILFATGLNILAAALKIFATFSWDSMAHGLVAMAGALGVIAAAVALMPKTMALQAVGLTVLGVALNVIAGALKIFGTMDYKTTAKALVAMAGALIVIAGAIALMPPTMALQAVGLLGVAVALNIIAGAMKILGTMSWEDIAKGMVAMAGAMLILAGGLYLMSGALPGAAATLIVAAALAVLTPILITLGNLSWGTIGKGLLTLALTFTLLGVAGLALGGVTPVLLGLGAAILLLGAGFALIGVGALAFATAFGIIVATVTSGVNVIVSTAIQLATAIPIIFVGFTEGLVKIALTIGKHAAEIAKAFGQVISALLDVIIKYTPKLLTAIGKILDSFLNIIIKETPKIGHAMTSLIHLILNVLDKNMGFIVDKGSDIIVKLLNGLAKNMPRLIGAGTNVIIAFIKGIGSNAVRIANAALQTIVDFINGIADAITKHSGDLRDAGMHLAGAIADGMTFGLASKVGDVAKAAGNMAKGALDGAKHFLGIHSPSKEFQKVGQFAAQGFVKGIDGSRDSVVKSWTSMHDLLAAAVNSSETDIKKYASKLDTLEKAHKKNTKAIRETKAELALATSEHIKASAALDNLNKVQAKHYTQLQNLGKQYDALTPKIDAANQALKDAIQTRDDYAKQVTDQYKTLPDIGGDVTVALQDTASQITSTTVDQTKTTTALQDYTTKLQDQVNDTVKFAQVVQQLRSLGLNDAMYQELISKGPASLQFAEELLAGGADAVKNVDGLSDQLAKAAGALGTKASQNLYQAGVNAAQGLVNGLVAKQKAIQKAMDKIAEDIVKIVKKKLHIKSPSEVMFGLAEFVGQGLIDGLVSMTDPIRSAAGDLGDHVIESMKGALAGINDAISSNIDSNPVIAPVVDLSAVHKGAAQLDIYRLTKNQISQVKGVVVPSAA